LKAHDLLLGSDKLVNQQDFSQLSKSIMTNSKSELKNNVLVV